MFQSIRAEDRLWDSVHRVWFLVEGLWLRVNFVLVVYLFFVEEGGGGGASVQGSKNKEKAKAGGGPFREVAAEAERGDP